MCFVEPKQTMCFEEIMYHLDVWMAFVSQQQQVWIWHDK